MFEHIQIHYKKNGEYLLNARGRLADKVAKENGFDGVAAISYVEMEYADNEAEYLLKVMGKIF